MALGLGLGLCCCGVDCCFGFIQDPHQSFAVVTFSGATAAPWTVFNGTFNLPYTGTFSNAHGFGMSIGPGLAYGIAVLGICYPAADPTRDGYWIRISEPAVPGREMYWHCGENPLFFPNTPTDPRCEMETTDGASWTHAGTGLVLDELVFS